MSWTRSFVVMLCLLSSAQADEPAEPAAKPFFVALIGGFDSEPTAEQLANKAPRGTGNSGMFQLAADLRRDGLQAEYFNWNGTAAGQSKTQPIPLAEGIAKRLRAQHQEHPTHKLAIVGNSWGGHTAWEVSQILAEKPTVPLDVVVFLDPSSVGRFDKPQPEKLPDNISHAVTYATRNAIIWRKWPNETRANFIDLGDPANGYLKKPGPAYDSLFDVKAHIAAEWDEAIHKDIRSRLVNAAAGKRVAPRLTPQHEPRSS